jgi:hypothetical protein
MKIVIPAQNVDIQTPTGIDPNWYQQLKTLEAFANLFSQVDPNALVNGQVLIWNAAQKKFLPGAN